MSYKLFDIEDNELFHHDLQDKSRWCKEGEKIEEAFVRQYGDQLGLIINPEKKSNPYAPDLLNTINGKFGDLKLQSTPFFKAQSLFKIDPTYAVVFNLKDKQRYAEKYPEIEIYYWVNWVAVKFEMGSFKTSVAPLNGVWKADFQDFDKHLTESPLHQYQQRVNDQRGNARSSFVCDIRETIFHRVV